MGSPAARAVYSLAGLAVCIILIGHYAWDAALAKAPGFARLSPLLWGGPDLLFMVVGYVAATYSGPRKSLYLAAAAYLLPLYFVAVATYYLSGGKEAAWPILFGIQGFAWGGREEWPSALISSTWAPAATILFCAALPIMRSRAVLAGAIVVAPLLRWVLIAADLPFAAYMALPARLDAFAWGMLLAGGLSARCLTWTAIAGLTGLGAVIALGGALLDFPMGVIGHSATCALGVAAIGLWPRLREARVVRWGGKLGKIAYPVVLFNFPCLILANTIIGPSKQAVAAALLFCIVASALSYALILRPAAKIAL